MILNVTRDQALEQIMLRCDPPGGFEVVTIDTAYGRVLSEDVKALHDIPDENKSAVDGYALNSSFASVVPVGLKIVSEVNAGQESTYDLAGGEAVFVATGARIPDGADCVVRVEDVLVDGDRLTVSFPVKKGMLVNFAGSEVKKGNIVAEEGTFVDRKLTVLLAYVGVYSLKVYRKPRVVVFATGDEVVEVYHPHRRGCVRNTSFYMLKWLLEPCGVDVFYGGLLKDDLDAISRALKSSLDNFDVVITTGGISRGRRDFVREAVRRIGVDVVFEQTNIKPGRPFVFGVFNDGLFFGLPGYPCAALVNTVEFLVPAMKKFSGMRRFENKYIKVVSGERFTSKRSRVDFVKAKIVLEGGTIKAVPFNPQYTSHFLSCIRCDGFVILPEGVECVEKGETVEFLPTAGIGQV